MEALRMWSKTTQASGDRHPPNEQYHHGDHLDVYQGFRGCGVDREDEEDQREDAKVVLPWRGSVVGVEEGGERGNEVAGKERGSGGSALPGDCRPPA